MPATIPRWFFIDAAAEVAFYPGMTTIPFTSWLYCALLS